MIYTYVRHSDKRQAQGDSIRRQTDRVARWLDEQERLTGVRPAVKVLSDSGSAFRGKNTTMGALADFLAKLKRGEVEKNSTILLENLDRLSREPHSIAHRLFSDVVDAKVAVITLHNSKRYAAPMSVMDTFAAIIEMDLAHQESKKKSERVKEAWTRAISERRLASHACPSWLERVKTGKHEWSYQPIKERVELLKKIFDHLAKNNGRGT